MTFKKEMGALKRAINVCKNMGYEAESVLLGKLYARLLVQGDSIDINVLAQLPGRVIGAGETVDMGGFTRASVAVRWHDRGEPREADFDRKTGEYLGDRIIDY